MYVVKNQAYTKANFLANAQNFDHSYEIRSGFGKQDAQES